ncbi:MAG TPA: glycosyltransferase family 2 protein [Smithella sp.]|nr:glycosyltransferase family 2 protein [Smithella sp.]
MDDLFDISIIIVNWNTKELLLNCVSTIQQAINHYKVEIIVVDNASNDGSVQALKDFYPHVKLIQNKENLGFAKANNLGIKSSSGKYVCLVNSDIEVRGDCLFNMYNYMDKHSTIAVLGPKVFYPDMTGQVSCTHFPTIWNNICEASGLHKISHRLKIFSGEHMRYFHHNAILKVDSLVGCFLMIRRSAIDQVGLLDERFFIYVEEVDWCKRFRNAGWDIVFMPDASVIHHDASSSSKDPLRFSAELLKSKIKYWKKHRGKIAVLIFLLITVMNHGVRLISESILYIIEPSKRTENTKRLLKNYSALKYVFGGEYIDNRTASTRK